MCAAVARGADTAYEVARAIQWATGTFDGFNTWQQRAAVTETLAHLEYARSRGMLSSEERENIVHYRRTD